MSGASSLSWRRVLSEKSVNFSGPCAPWRRVVSEKPVDFSGPCAPWRRVLSAKSIDFQDHAPEAGPSGLILQDESAVNHALGPLGRPRQWGGGPGRSAYRRNAGVGARLSRQARGLVYPPPETPVYRVPRSRVGMTSRKAPLKAWPIWWRGH